MGWFKRLKDGIQTTTKNKKEAPDGLWHKCTSCKETFTAKEMKENYYVCPSPSCNHHERIGSYDYFDILFGENDYDILFNDIYSYDFLEFVDVKKYSDRLETAKKKTDLIDAMSVAVGQLSDDIRLTVAAMDFSFIGGSMGSVVGEKICRAIEHSLTERIPLMIISKSGGARMMESAFSLMQMAKTSVMLSKLAEAEIPYISFLTDPTTGGVTASYSMLGDLNIAEPNALIGFAGPRVIKETIKKDLPEGFQRSEFLIECGFLDYIVDRKSLRSNLTEMLGYLRPTQLVS